MAHFPGAYSFLLLQGLLALCCLGAYGHTPFPTAFYRGFVGGVHGRPLKSVHAMAMCLSSTSISTHRDMASSKEP